MMSIGDKTEKVMLRIWILQTVRQRKECLRGSAARHAIFVFQKKSF
jgi:hypothetical protein